MTRLILLLLVTCSLLSAQDTGTQTTISGTISGADGKPLSGAVVRLYRLTYSMAAGPKFSVTEEGDCTTKADGLFTFKGEAFGPNSMSQGSSSHRRRGWPWDGRIRTPWRPKPSTSPLVKAKP